MNDYLRSLKSIFKQIILFYFEVFFCNNTLVSAKFLRAAKIDLWYFDLYISKEKKFFEIFVAIGMLQIHSADSHGFE